MKLRIHTFARGTVVCGNDDVRSNNRFLPLSNQTLISIHALVQLTPLINVPIN